MDARGRRNALGIFQSYDSLLSKAACNMGAIFEFCICEGMEQAPIFIKEINFRRTVSERYSGFIYCNTLL